MPATPFDSAHLSSLFPTGSIGALFSDSAEIRAMMLVEAALAEAQAAHGVIPQDAATAIRRAAHEAQIDPAALAQATGQNGVSVPGLVAAMRAAIPDAHAAQYLHWGATSQDIQDSGLMLRLARAVALQRETLAAFLAVLADLAETEAETPMVARTYGQAAVPTSFGARVCNWGRPLLQLYASPPKALLSLSGAAGTGSQLGTDPVALRSAMAQKLGLTVADYSWHVDRSQVLGFAQWFAEIARILGKFGDDVILSVQSGVAEITITNAGASSTMPQKQNPVAASAIVALARHAIGLQATLMGAGMPRQERDGAAWFTEWLALPQLVLSSAAALEQGTALAGAIAPNRDAMRAGLDADGGAALAETLSFALARHMPRPEAQAAIKAAAADTREKGGTLAENARARFPDLPAGVFDTAHSLGTAPADARSFARAVRALLAKPDTAV